ncbi:MAG: FAD/NAD(P)-binding oxidoreductase [Candidatus Nanopelagicales bacterium]
MSTHHQIVIIGGGSAGITVAARLKRAGASDVAVIDPSDVHYYQPLWTLVGGGRARDAQSVRPMSWVMPRGVHWIHDSVTGISPESCSIALASGDTITYDRLVVAAGIQLNWDGIPGLADAMGHDGMSSNYDYYLAPKTWENVQRTRSGTAIFHMPAGPIKCAGAPQKIAYLAADYWREQGVLDNIRKIMILPTPGMFGVKVWSDVLVDVAARYGFEVHLNTVVTSVDAAAHTMEIKNNETGETQTLPYNFAHMVPPQSAPDWLAATPLVDADSPFGYMAVDKFTLQSTKYPEVFGLGDCTNTPNSKTGAAIRKQAPVVVENLMATLKGGVGSGHYDGYASCPITTSRKKLLLCEFDYDLNLRPSLKGVDQTKEIVDYNRFKKVGLPRLYWDFMLKGRA